MPETQADLLSLGMPLEYEGKKYELRKPNQLEQGKYQRWLESQGMLAIERQEWASEEKMVAAIRDHIRDCAAGEYEWGGTVASRRLMSAVGMAKLLEIVCEIPNDLALKITEDHSAKVVAVLTAASTNDPKALEAALQTLGLPSGFLSSDSATPRSIKRKRKSKR